jgi:hypothetical protein
LFTTEKVQRGIDPIEARIGQVARDQTGDILDGSGDKIWRETDLGLADIPIFRIEYLSDGEWASESRGY